MVGLGHNSASAFSSTGAGGLNRSSASVISSSSRTPSSPYNIKQEPDPGSPAGRIVKTEIGNNSSPHSPRTVTLSPPPPSSGKSCNKDLLRF